MRRYIIKPTKKALEQLELSKAGWQSNTSKRYLSLYVSLLYQFLDKKTRYRERLMMNTLQTSTKIAISDFKKEVSKKGIELIILDLETPAIYDPTVKMLFISKRMIDENECMDSDFVEQIKERFGIAR